MTSEENFRAADLILDERERLGYSMKQAPYADCICVGCRSPVGWNRCARDVPPYSTMLEHQQAMEHRRRVLQPEVDRFNEAFGCKGVL